MQKLFDSTTTSVMYGRRGVFVQRILDFDYLSGRQASIECMVDEANPGAEAMFYGTKPFLMPVYASLEEAVKAHPNAKCFLNFASERSAYDVALKAISAGKFTSMVVVAEGVPERQARQLAAICKEKNILAIGPASVGVIRGGEFRGGNAGGAQENVAETKLYSRGSAGIITKSSGMLNELCNLCSQNADGVAEAVSVGGDSFPLTTMADHALRMQKDDSVKFIVLLGEIGGEQEVGVAKLMEEKKITKPVIAWTIGTIAPQFKREVQFGHAGARSGSQKTSAQAKNSALKKAGASVPLAFNELGKEIAGVYQELLKKGEVKAGKTQDHPPLPLDFANAKRQSLVRRMPSIVSHLAATRDGEPVFGGSTISELVEAKEPFASVVARLWFYKKLPKKTVEAIDLILVLMADHGPHPSGPHNTIVAARAGRDLPSAVASGLLTIGPRFGGAVSDAAKNWWNCVLEKKDAMDFVEEMKKKGVLIPGIGHRVKSKNNPDMRVKRLCEWAEKNIGKHEHLDYALSVEEITLAKRPNLILNVDGAAAAVLLDALKHDAKLSDGEIEKALDAELFNGIFVLARTAGLIAHYADQKRLGQGLWRTPDDEVLGI
ncbi:MAG TPA: citrate/2-methylcitrate synthase [Candidatus Norongarragalinales archaeon]|nr:citrate/2-methylcitrate synthase [Candidatus Norongarragalinales archaeon]